jgi:cbb3-type cytochrome oxidase subunit 3
MFRQLQMVAAGDLRLFGLLLFFLMFVAVLARWLSPGRRATAAALARLPLAEDDAVLKERAP